MKKTQSARKGAKGDKRPLSGNNVSVEANTIAQYQCTPISGTMAPRSLDLTDRRPQAHHEIALVGLSAR
jgi:hypothetical protein